MSDGDVIFDTIGRLRDWAGGYGVVYYDGTTFTATTYLTLDGIEVYGDAYLDGTTYGTFAGDGFQLGNLSASALTSGTVPIARLNGGVGSTAQFLRRDGSWTNTIGGGYFTLAGDGTSGGNAYQTIQAANNGADAKFLFYGGGTLYWLFGKDAGTGNLNFQYEPAGRASRFYIDSSGNVGFGTTSPAARLDVAGPVRPGVYTVATLPTPGTAGRIAYATNARVSGEGSGAGTGSVVTDSGSAWRIAGTNTTAVA